MNELIKIEGNRAVTTSLKVAEVFGKQHKDILKAIGNLECSEEFGRLNFAPTQIDFKMPTGGIRKDKAYTITKDGFVFLAMGFTGAKAAKFKEEYIKAFNDMESGLNQLAKNTNDLANSIADAMMNRANQNAVKIVQLENENKLLRLFAPKCGIDRLGRNEEKQKIRRGAEVKTTGKGRPMSMVFNILLHQPELPFTEFSITTMRRGE